MLKDNDQISISNSTGYRVFEDVSFAISKNGVIVAMENVERDIWLLVRDGEKFFSVIIYELMQKYDVEKRRLVKDISDYLIFLFKLGLITINGTETPKAAVYKGKGGDKYYQYCMNHVIIGKVHIELTYSCNFRCYHCYVGHKLNMDKSSMMSLADILGVLDQIAEMGCLMIVFTGGEIFTRTDIVEILEYAHQKNFYIQLSTNASLLTPEMFNKIKHIAIGSIDVSLYGGTAETHDCVTRRQGSFGLALEKIESLSKDYGKLYLKHVMTSFTTKNDIERFDILCQNLDIKTYNNAIAPLFPQRNDKGMSEYSIKDEVIAYDVSRTNPGRKGDNVNMSCTAGSIRAAISAEGDIVPCEFLAEGFVFGNIKKDRIAEVWKESRELMSFRQLLKEENACSICSMREFCPRCPAMSYLHSGDIRRCSPEARRIAKHIKETADAK